ncbi:MAG: DUF3566 domain-containing protein [Candidatus Zixiibacteriota bacterium]
MRYEIKSIGMWPFIKVSFFFNLIVGFLFGLCYALMAGFIMTIASRLSQFQPEFFEFAPIEPMPIGIMLVVMPIMFGILGAIFYTIVGVILALIYNLIAKLVGGFEFALEPVAAGMAPGGQPLTGYTGAPTPATPAPGGPAPLSTLPSAPPDSRTDQGGEAKPES